MIALLPGLLKEARRTRVETDRVPIQLEWNTAIAEEIAACGPLGIKTVLASAHLAIDASEADALSRLDVQYGALLLTHDFVEGREAEAQDRAPVYHGN